MDAIVKILLHQGIEALLKWVDDFIFFRYPKQLAENKEYKYSYAEDIIWNTAEKLGWPWAPSKFLPFAFAFIYIGFLWDLSTREVSLPEAKRKKYTQKLKCWTKGAKISLEDTESITGTLNHICMVVPQGRSRMPTLY